MGRILDLNVPDELITKAANGPNIILLLRIITKRLARFHNGSR